MVMWHEFLCNPTVRVLRWNEKLLKFPYILMFHVHNTIQVVKYDSTNNQGTLSVISRKIMVGTSPLFPFEGYCSDFNYFTKVVRDALDSLKLFQPHNRELLSERIPQFFHSCYKYNPNPDPSSHKIVIMVKIFGNTVYHDEQATREFNADEKTDVSGKVAAALKLHAEVICDEYLHDEEDYSVPELKGILGNIIHELRRVQGYQLSTRSNIDELLQVKAAIKLLPFNGRRCGEDECAICYEGFCENLHLARMPCSHIFHKHCALVWLLRSDVCPLCRSACKNPII